MTPLARSTVLLLLAALGGTAHAQSALTRAQVRAQTLAAIRNGDMPAPGDSGLRLNELFPQRYPAPRPEAGKSRAQVQAELVAALQAGDVLPVGDGSLPQAEAPAGKTRAQVRAELAEAVRRGDLLAPDDSGLRLNERFPQRYPAPAPHQLAGRSGPAAGG